MKWRYIPNIITIIRIMLVFPFLYTLSMEQYRYAFFLFMFAGFSDGADGFLARRFDWTSKFGGFVDPLADKLLMMSSFLALAYLGRIPIWLTLLVIMRDVVIMCGVGGLYVLFGDVDFNPSMISKINTACQVLLVFLVLFELAYHALPIAIIYSLMGIVAITASLSLINYAWIWGRKVFAERPEIGS